MFAVNPNKLLLALSLLLSTAYAAEPPRLCSNAPAYQLPEGTTVEVTHELKLASQEYDEFLNADSAPLVNTDELRCLIDSYFYRFSRNEIHGKFTLNKSRQTSVITASTNETWIRFEMIWPQSDELNPSMSGVRYQIYCDNKAKTPLTVGQLTQGLKGWVNFGVEIVSCPSRI